MPSLANPSDQREAITPRLIDFVSKPSLHRFAIHHPRNIIRRCIDPKRFDLFRHFNCS
jgi:hypothetical protein